MMPDPLLDDVAGAVLDGGPVDWADAEARADATATAVVKHLRVLSRVAGIHRRSASDLLRGRERDLPVETWGHLRLLERVGRGAFGEVYRAWDTRLDREVALKLLPAPAAGGSASAIIEEGRLLARVRHPGVVTIHGAEQIGDRVGLWMEYIRGRTLGELIEDRGTFTPEDVIQIGLELSRAVAAVHDAGLIHRDIKAHNVIRADDGRVMLMDFGTGLEASAAGSTPAGTPLYLAPELFAGQAATVQSDVYSLGVLLYHLLTGTYPVGGKSLRDVRLAHERGERTALADARPNLPRRLIRAIEHAIDPQPESRCESATALAAQLRSAQGGSRRRWIVGSAAAAALFMLWMSQTSRADTTANRSLADIARAPAAPWWAALWPAHRPKIVVLPFKNLGTVGGSDLLAEGLTFEVINRLATVEGLDVLAGGSSFAFADKPHDLAAARSQLKASVALEGELFMSEERVRVTARLVNLADNVSSPIGADATFDRRDRDLLAIQEELAVEIVKRLRLKLVRQQHYDLEPALQAKFLTARALAEKHDPRYATEAVNLLEEIVKNAPSHAPAWGLLASALGSILRLDPGRFPTFQPRLKEAALKAHGLDPLLAEAHAAIGVVHAYDLEWAQARQYFEQALSLNRSITSIHTDAALSLLLPLAKLDEALDLLEVARYVDPLSLDVHRTLAAIQVDAELYKEAIWNARWVLDRDPTYPFAANRRGRALALLGRLDEALRVFEEDKDNSGPAYVGYVGYVYAVTGRHAEAEALAARAPNPAAELLIYGGLGDKERAFDALERLRAANPWRAATWMMRPEVKFLRDDPRFEEIRRQQLRIPK
jgi:serine/threonine-protein kinase